MKNFNETNYKNLIRFTYGITNIAFWFISVVGAIVLLALVTVAIIPTDVFSLDLSSVGDGYINIEIGDTVKYEMEQDLSNVDNYKLIIIAGLFAGSIYMALASVILFFIRRILGDVTKGNPFSEKNIKSLFVIGYTFLVTSILKPLAEYIFANVAIHKLDIKGIEASFGLDMTMIFIGLLLLVLASIFKYGAYLQDEVDQTV